MTLEQTISAIRPLDEKSMTAARNRFTNIAMPLGGLGLLQDAIVPSSSSARTTAWSPRA